MPSNKDWKRISLREACDMIQYGYTASANEKPVGPKFLRITDIVPSLIDWQSVPHCEISKINKKKYELKEGDIVIARTGATTGFAKRIKKQHPDSIFASYLVRIRLKDGFDDKYFGAVIESELYKKFIKANLGGAAQPNANAQVLTSFPLVVPPLSIQQRTASILSTYDDLIENNIRRFAILEEIARRIYEEWLVHFRFPGHEKFKMVKSELEPIPEGWQIKKLEDLAAITMGQSPPSEYYNDVGNGLPFHQGVADFGPRFPEDRIYCTIQNRLAEPQDTLMSVRAPVGRLNISTKRIVIGRGLCAIKSKFGQQAILFQQLKDHFRDEDTMGSGTIFKAVTKQDVYGIKFIKADDRIAAELEEWLTPLFRQLEILSSKNINLRKTRDLLLPKLISGEIDVSHFPAPEQAKV